MFGGITCFFAKNLCISFMKEKGRKTKFSITSDYDCQ